MASFVCSKLCLYSYAFYKYQLFSIIFLKPYFLNSLFYFFCISLKADPELRKLTKFALEKLERTAALVKPRKEVPSLLELNSLSVCSPIISQIVFLDGTTKAVYIDSARYLLLELFFIC